MFSDKKTIQITGATIVELWEAHADVKNWHKWQPDIEWTKVEGKIKEGSKFTIKPKGAPKVNLKVITFDQPKQFTDLSYLPFCKMFTTTKMIEKEEGVEITLEIQMKGLLTFIWKKLVAKAILEIHQQQNEAMVQYINTLKNEKN